MKIKKMIEMLEEISKLNPSANVKLHGKYGESALFIGSELKKRRKYDIRICKCGRIHAIPNEKIEKALEADKNFLLICAACGNATLIGADISPDLVDPSKDCYEMYSGDFSLYEDKVINTDAFKGNEKEKAIEEIFYSHGIKVPMKTGQYATDYFNGIFSDRWYPDFYKIQRTDITVNEIMDFIDEYIHDRTTVNMNRFINETPDDILDELSNYLIDGLNWKGTKFEKEWHK